MAEICESIALGLTAAQACAAEGVKIRAWEKALERWPDLRAQLQAAQGKFLAETVRMLRESPKGHAGRQFILERRHLAEWGKRNADISLTQTVNQITISEADMVALQEAAQRRVAREISPVSGGAENPKTT